MTDAPFEDSPSLNTTELLVSDFTTNAGNADTRELRGKGGGSYGVKISCGYCDTTCVYGAIESVFLLGVFANILVIFRVAKDKNLHDPTFVAIAALALADMLFLILNLTTSFETVILTITCTSPKIISTPFYALKSILWFSANAHVALLAVLRYVMMAYPLRSNVFLSVKRVILFSVGVWILGIVLMGAFSALIAAGIVVAAKSQEFLLILWITVYLIPLLVTVILHLVKLFIVKQTTKESATESTRKSIQRMSRIVVAVIVMAAVLPLPRLVNSCLKLSGANAYPSPEFKTHYGAIADLLFLINNFVNPFIYGFLSIKFRQSVRRMFNCEVTEDEYSAETMDTPLSVRRQNIGMGEYPRKKSSFDSLDSFDKM